MSSPAGSHGMSSENMYVENANRARQYVNNLNYSSSNRGEELDGLSAAHSDVMGTHANTIYGAVHGAMIKDLGRQEEDPAIAALLAPVATARILGFANCEARAGLAFLHLVENGVKPVEQFSFVGGDHVALVLGRDPRTPFTDPSKWNDDAIICDPWLNETFRVHELSAKIAQSETLRELVGEGPYRFSRAYWSTSADSWPPSRLQALCTKFNIS